MPSYMNAVELLTSATGIVIPVYFPTNADPGSCSALLRETAQSFLREVGDPRSICLSADGGGVAAAAAESLAKELGVQRVQLDRNRGKLGALRAGMALLLKEPRLKYFVTVDQDGDHFANELLNFIRAAQHVEARTATDRVMVLGRRISRHRPMGFLRGELEELADRVLLDALHYHAAKSGQPLNLTYAATMDEFPDFHSGYKLFARATASAVFLAEPVLAGAGEEAYYRHGVEAVMSVEAILSGAILAVVNRSTIDEQPVSAFGQLNRRRMIADKIVWPCKRLNVPPAFVAQWMDNHLPRILLGSLVPEGRDELLEIRRLVLEAFGIQEAAPRPSTIPRPPFI
jgi:hypothetical protein